MARTRAARSDGHAVEVVVREHPLRALVHRQRSPVGPPLDVHVLGAEPNRLRQHLEPLRLEAAPLPALPGRPARHDDRPAAARQRAGDVEVRDAVETQLDQVGVLDRVPRGAQLGHRRGRHGFADECAHPTLNDDVHKKGLFSVD